MVCRLLQEISMWIKVCQYWQGRNRPHCHPPPPTPTQTHTRNWYRDVFLNPGCHSKYLKMITMFTLKLRISVSNANLSCHNSILIYYIHIHYLHPLHTCIAQTRISVQCCFVLWWAWMFQALFSTKKGDMSEVRFHVFNIYSILQSLNNYTIMMVRIYTFITKGSSSNW